MLHPHRLAKGLSIVGMLAGILSFVLAASLVAFDSWIEKPEKGFYFLPVLSYCSGVVLALLICSVGALLLSLSLLSFRRRGANSS